MKEMLKKKMQEKLQNSEGFTLLEILVVLTIMGFLIAMVAPRLAGISGGAVDTVCDSNQSRMLTMMSSFYEKANRYPTKLTNIVEQAGANAWQIPAISDDDPDNGPETLASEFNSRNHFRIHYLNGAEIRELKNMGIVKVLNLNSYDGYDPAGPLKAGYDNATNDVLLAGNVLPADRGPAMEEVTLDAAAPNAAVMMVGFGALSNADAPAWSDVPVEPGWGEPDFFARMVFGFGPENSLVTSGLVSNAAHCPGGIQNQDNVTYNDYNLVLPRLQSTVDRYDAVMTGMDQEAATEGVQLGAVSYDKEPVFPYDYSANADLLKVRTVTIGAMESYQYATMCPEGHKFPADDGEYWGVNFDPADSEINN